MQQRRPTTLASVIFLVPMAKGWGDETSARMVYMGTSTNWVQLRVNTYMYLVVWFLMPMAKVYKITCKQA